MCDQVAGIRYWPDLWRKVEPNDPELKQLELLCRGPQTLKQILNTLQRPGRKR